jgi:hypothetical protein
MKNFLNITARNLLDSCNSILECIQKDMYSCFGLSEETRFSIVDNYINNYIILEFTDKDGIFLPKNELTQDEVELFLKSKYTEINDSYNKESPFPYRMSYKKNQLCKLQN